MIGQEKDRERFEKINQFMRDVTGNNSLTLEIPHDQSSIYVSMDGKRLDIESLGSGIEQVLIIAAKSTLFEKQIVCIEEPEIYLHPTLQRKLMHYLNDKTSNQYFIATHSPHFLDSVPAATYHIRLQDGYSEVMQAVSDVEKFHVCVDLGYKASDILQTNFIIWVEGPSDRIYVKHWIKGIAPNLKEGLHYSVMFYGGKSVSHLSISDDTFDDLIKIQKLNRNMAIIIDSDRRVKGGRLDPTKVRLESEFKKGGHFSWITLGREIENYVPDTEFLDAIKATHPSAKLFPKFGQYEDQTIFWISEKRNKKSLRDISKIKVARQVCNNPPDYSNYDLNRRIKELVSHIEKANLINV